MITPGKSRIARLRRAPMQSCRVPQALLIVGALALALALVSSAAGGSGSHLLSASASDPYARRTSVDCLRHRGAIVAPVKPSNARLRALRDLAQKTSLQARIGKAVVGLAFSRSESDAVLLVDLLQVPKDPLRLERQRNVVMLSPKRATGARAAVLGCLRT